MHLYLIRHADPDYENDTLTPQGWAEARALAKRFGPIGLTAIYSSCTVRSEATAACMAEAAGGEVIREPWIMEPAHLTVRQDGRRFMMWDTFGETVRAGIEMPTQSTWTDRPPFDAPEVRTMWTDFRGRIDELVAAHGYIRENGRYRIERRNRDRVAVVTHNGTVLLFLAHLLELPVSLCWSGFYSWPASVTTIFFEEHSDEWAVPRALGVADLSHLHTEGLEPQPRGMGGDRYEPYV